MRRLFAIALLTAGAYARADSAPATHPASAPATRPSAGAATTRAAETATSKPDDALATPEAAVLHLFELMRQNNVAEVRSMAIDPPPAEQLKQQVQAVSWKLSNGAKFEIVETKIEKSAAAVLYRTIYPKGRTEVTPVLLVQRYERWKAMLNDYNPRKFTPAEKEDLVAVTNWMQPRLQELNPPATQPAK